MYSKNCMYYVCTMLNNCVSKINYCHSNYTINKNICITDTYIISMSLSHCSGIKTCDSQPRMQLFLLTLETFLDLLSRRQMTDSLSKAKEIRHQIQELVML